MATPRKRFASIETSLLREGWPDELRLSAVLLILHMTDRWAADKLTAAQAIRCRLTPGDLLNVTSATSIEQARERLAALADLVSMRVVERGNTTEVVWAKLADTQGWNDVDAKRNAASRRVYSGHDAPSAGNGRAIAGQCTAPPHPHPHPHPQEEKNYEPAAAAAANKQPRKRAAAAAVPDDLSPDEKVELRDWVRDKHPTLEPQLRDLVDACLDHHRKSGNRARITHWVAACRTWIRNHASGRFSNSRDPTVQAVRASEVTQQAAELIRSNQEARAHARRAAGIGVVPADVRRLRPAGDA